MIEQEGWRGQSGKQSEILEKLDNGETKTSVGHLGANESIKKSEKAIKASASGAHQNHWENQTTQNAKIGKKERDLHLWLLKQKDE